MAALVDIVLAAGRTDATEDGTACALWMSVPAEEAHEGGQEGEQGGDDGPAPVREAVDPGNERIELVGRLTGGIHPSGRAHEYLWLIAVAPEYQGQGLGTALVQPVLDRCDREGVPACQEASNSRSRALYERLGFAFTGRTVAAARCTSGWASPSRAVRSQPRAVRAAGLRLNGPYGRPAGRPSDVADAARTPESGITPVRRGAPGPVAQYPEDMGRDEHVCPVCGQPVATVVRRHKTLGAYVPVWGPGPCRNPECKACVENADETSRDRHGEPGVRGTAGRPPEDAAT